MTEIETIEDPDILFKILQYHEEGLSPEDISQKVGITNLNSIQNVIIANLESLASKNT